MTTSTTDRPTRTGTLAVVAERVARGVALLDQHRPDWYRQIDANYLELRSHSDCVLGQLFGDYGTGSAVLGIRPDGMAETEAHYGFDITSDEAAETYEELRAEWLRVVSGRLAVSR